MVPSAPGSVEGAAGDPRSAYRARKTWTADLDAGLLWARVGVAARFGRSCMAGGCRVHFTIEVGNVPKVAEFFMRQQMKKDQPQNAARLKSLIASRV